MSITSETDYVLLETENNLYEHNKISKDYVHIINPKRKTCIESKISEILNPVHKITPLNDYIILIQNVSEEAIIQIKNAYSLHQAIVYECKSTYVYDHMVNLDECLFIELADIPTSGLLTSPGSLKVILLKNLMFLLINERISCIDEVFVKNLNFSIYPQLSFNLSEAEKVELEVEKVFSKFSRKFTIVFSLEQTYGFTVLEEILYMILHAMFIRLEELVDNIDKEIINCNEFAYELSPDERIDIIMRIHVAKKNVSLAQVLIETKGELLIDIIQNNYLSKTFNHYLYSMAMNMRKLNEKLESSNLLLKNSENLNNSIVDEKRTQIMEKATDLMKIFSAITAIVSPLMVLGSAFGMNILIPFQSDIIENPLPFAIICSVSLGYFIIAVTVFRFKEWI